MIDRASMFAIAASLAMHVAIPLSGALAVEGAGQHKRESVQPIRCEAQNQPKNPPGTR
jgi:hypothetical protein